MKDPLTSFDWSSLHHRYDDKCRGFDRASTYLDAFKTDRPESDRSLYYKLINAFSEERRSITTTTNPIEIYEALLYWKLYSQPAAISNTVLKLREDSALRKETERSLPLLFQALPAKLEKNAASVLNIIKELDDFKIHGMKSSTALPVRTTLLHFLYPSVVPIFDKMVLQAVGVWDKHANQSPTFLREYLSFAWVLADRYTQNLSGFERETSIRIIDMALWVGRGTESMDYISSVNNVSKESGTDKIQHHIASHAPIDSNLSVPERVRLICQELSARGTIILRKDILILAKERGINEASVLPADYCDNTETGKWSRHSFLHSVGPGKYILR